MPKYVLIIFQTGVISKWTNDSQRLMLEHFDAIRDSPSYIYHSALPFSPSSSWLQKSYSTDLSLTVRVVKGLPAEWGMCSRTVFLDSFTRTLSCWDNTIAIGSRPGDIIIIDAITGSQTAVLSRHTGEVNSLMFSLDGTFLVSGSYDCTVKLWDVQSGGDIKTFYGHTYWVWSVSISIDCTRIASGSRDGTLRLWNIQTGECYHTVRQQGSVYHVSFSPMDPQYLISICDNKVWQWNTNGHQINPLFNGSCIAFSSDRPKFVSCYGAVATVQNPDPGTIVAKFQAANYDIQCCCLSLDSRLVAITAGGIIYIWDITSCNPYLVATLPGHNEDITSLVFSSPSTLISASKDRSVRFWQVGALSADPAVKNLGSSPITFPLISSISLQASDGIAISSDIDGVVKTWDIPTSLCKVSPKSTAEGYKHGDVKIINSRLVFVWHADEKINIWDPKKGKFLLQADIPGHNMLDLRISGDGSKIFCINKEFIQVWDMWTGEAMGRVEFLGYIGVELLAMEGSRVWMKIPAVKPCAWDFGITGPSPIELNTPPPDRLHLNDTKLWDNNLYRIQDSITGKVVFQLPEGFQSYVVEMQWDGQYLVISLKSQKELILEFHPAFLQ